MRNECVEIAEREPGAKGVGAFSEEPGPRPGRTVSLREAGGARPRAWERMKSLCGRVILSICPQGRTECERLACQMRPFCACARADRAAANQVENTVWLALGALGALALALAVAILRR